MTGPATSRLFCFPFGGAGGSLYADWQTQLPSGVELVAINLPGREGLLGLEPLISLEPVLAGLCAQLETELDCPYALFGHSIGAGLAFEVARELRRRGWPAPEALFVSAWRAPQLQEARHYEDDEQTMLDEVLSWGGFPEEQLDDELLDLVLPALRADLVLSESIGYLPEKPLDYPIVAFACSEDRLPLSTIEPWAEQTTAGFTLEVVPGGHFVIKEHPQRWLDSVAAHLREAR